MNRDRVSRVLIERELAHLQHAPQQTTVTRATNSSESFRRSCTGDTARTPSQLPEAGQVTTQSETRARSSVPDITLIRRMVWKTTEFPAGVLLIWRAQL